MKSLITKIFLALLLFFPLVVLAQVKLQDPLQVGSPVEIFARIVTALVIFTGILAIIFFVLGGVRILTAAGSPEKFTKGKNILMYSVIGFVATISSYYILIQVIDVLTGGQLVDFKAATALVNPLNIFPMFEIFSFLYLNYI